MSSALKYLLTGSPDGRPWTDDAGRTTPGRTTLEHVLAVPGLGAQIMASLPVPERVRLRRTCRAFLAGADESLVNVTELFAEDFVPERVGQGCAGPGLHWLVTKCPHLRALSVVSRTDHAKLWIERRHAPSPEWPWSMGGGGSGRVRHTTPPLEEVARAYGSLTCLNLAGCYCEVTDAGLVALARACPDLQVLDVSDCDQVTDATIAKVAECCPRLTRVAVASCRSVSNRALESLGRHCDGLTDLNAGDTCATDRGVAALAQGCTKLRRLVLPGNVTDEAIKHVAEHCHALEELLVWSKCEEMGHGVTNEGLKLLTVGCPLLTRLDVARCDRVAKGGISALAQKCRGLCHLDVAETSVSDGGLKAVGEHCAQLEYLNVADCGNVTNVGIKAVARGCPRLRHLCVARCRRVNDAGICAVAKNCPGMRKLVLGRSGVEDAGIKAIGAHCRELRFLSITFCSVQGNSLAVLARGCPKLEHLDVSWSWGAVTQEAVAALSLHCTQLHAFLAEKSTFGDSDVETLFIERGLQLEMLDLSESYITDETLMLVAEFCPRLQGLVIKACDVTDAGMSAVAAECKGLRYLDVSGCDGVTRASLSLLDRGTCMVEGHDPDRLHDREDDGELVSEAVGTDCVRRVEKFVG